MQKKNGQCPFNIKLIIKQLYLSVIIVCFGTLSIYVQGGIEKNVQYRFTNLSMRDGLPDSTIIDVFRQESGLMWFGTPSGASSYNGDRFTNYNTRSIPAIIGNKVTYIIEDSRGDVWISTTEGVSRIHNGIESQHYSMVEQQSYWSNYLYHDSLGGVWSANNEGLAKLNTNDQFEYVAFHEGDNQAYVISITEYNQQLYISTTKGIFKLDYQIADAEPEYIVRPGALEGTFGDQDGDGFLSGMFNNQDGDIWYSMYFSKGLYRFNIENETLTHVAVPGFEDAWFSNIVVNNGSLLLSSFDEGLISYSPTNREAFQIQHNPKKSDSILSDEVMDVLVDDSGILWCGTSKGISYYSFLKRGSHINLDDSIISAEAKIFQTAPLHDGSVLVTSDDGIALFDLPSKTINSTAVKGLDGVRVYSVSVAADNQSYWFAHEGGITHHDVISDTTTTYGEQFNNQFQLPATVFYTIWGLNENEALVSSHFGGAILRFHKERGVIERYLDDTSNLYAYTKGFSYASVVSQEQLWLASTVGLINIKLSSGEYHILLPTTEDKATEFVDVAVDENATIWAAATDYGLFTAVPFSGNKPYQLIAVDGLENKQITNVVPDNQVLWLSTKTEILKYDSVTKVITEFPNLLNDWEVRFIPNSMSINNGHLTVGSSTGLISINSNTIGPNLFRPSTIFTDITSGDISLSHLINQSSVELPYDLHNLEFSFASLDYHDSDRVQYQYRLTGFDTTWVQTKQNRANYTNLPWGHYIFEVLGSNSDGVWSDKVIQFSFTITPAWWYYVIIGLAITAVCFLAMVFYSRHKRLKQLQQEARRDPLTGIGNRAQFNETLQQQIERDKPFALILFDIRNLKHINDSKGYWFGDALIQAVAERLVNWLQKTGELARIGGGEFSILTRAYEKPQVLNQYVSELLATLLCEYKVEQETLRCAFNIGVNQYPQGGGNAILLHKNCDLAFFKSKQKEPNSVVFFDQQLEKDVRYLMGINQDLNRVIENQQLFLAYQPKWSIDTLQFKSAEALVRWQHPSHGAISPAVFIKQAEANGNIVEIGYWIIDSVCKHMTKWRQQGLEFGRVAVNISPIQLQLSNFFERTLSIIDSYDLPPNMLEFEITESVLLGDTQGVVNVLNRLREVGISIALDDFGTGYSSLNYLTRLPLDTLKIDKSLIDSITTHPQQQAIFASTALLANELNLSVVVEGIETQAQLDVIRQYPCALGQGYLLSKPLTEKAFRALMQPSDATDVAGRYSQ